MARIEVKEKGKNIVNKLLLGIAVGFLAAVLVGAIVITVLILTNKDDEPEEKEVVEMFPTAQLITYDDLLLIENNDEKSSILDGKVQIYIYVYNSDYETYEDAEKLHDRVAECVAAYNTYLEETADEDEVFGFYIINAAEEENSALNTGKLPYLLTFGPDIENAGEEITNLRDIQNGLFEAKELVK